MSDLFNEKTTVSEPTSIPQEKIVSVIPIEKERIIDSSFEAMIMKAMDKGADAVALMEKLIAMRDAEKAKKAKELFDENFIAMQKDFTVVKKSKEATDKEGNLLYAYCPLPNILKVYGPILSNHGFSYRWSGKTIEGKIRQTTCILSGFGHTEEGAFDIPIEAANNYANQGQRVASAQTFGERHSFNALIGVVIEGEDDDANSLTFDDGVTYAADIHAIRDCKTLDELKATFPAIFKRLAGDFNGQRTINSVKDAKKKEFLGTKNGTT